MEVNRRDRYKGRGRQDDSIAGHIHEALAIVARRTAPSEPGNCPPLPPGAVPTTSGPTLANAAGIDDAAESEGVAFGRGFQEEMEDVCSTQHRQTNPNKPTKEAEAGPHVPRQGSKDRFPAKRAGVVWGRA